MNAKLTPWLLSALLLAGSAWAGSKAPPKKAPPAAAAPAPEPAYVGLTVPPLPAGLDDEGGYLLPTTNGTTYGIALVARGSQHMWWLQRLLGHTPDGRPNWSVEAVQPAPPSEHHFVFAQCALEGTPDPAIIAEAALENAPTLTHVMRAWKAQPAERRFAPLPATGVTCVNEGYGIDE